MKPTETCCAPYCRCDSRMWRPGTTSIAPKASTRRTSLMIASRHPKGSVKSGRRRAADTEAGAGGKVLEVSMNITDAGVRS